MDILSKLDAYLHNQGNVHLSIILLALSALGIIVALFAPPEVKLGFILWWLLP